MDMYNGGLILNGVQIFRERGVVPSRHDEEEFNRMSDGSLTSEFAWSKRIINAKYDFLEPEIIAYLWEISKDVITVKYYDADGTNAMPDFQEPLFLCTGQNRLKLHFDCVNCEMRVEF